MTSPMVDDPFGWNTLRHGGLLLDKQRLRQVATLAPATLLSPYRETELRRQVARVQDGTLATGEFAKFVLEEVCGVTAGLGTWTRGSAVEAKWSHTAVTGEAVKPQHLWRGDFGAVLPVFVDKESRLGIGRGTRVASLVLQWLRGKGERLALLTNGRQWRLIFAGLDFDAWCQWDVDLWFEEGLVGSQVTALRTLIQPALWTPTRKGVHAPLAQAILDSRKGQAELSAVLGERVREAVELLVQAHGEVLRARCAAVPPSDIYRAAVRVVMRLVIVLFAESRERLLPRDNALYHGSYSLAGLREELDKLAARSGTRLRRSYHAWPRVLALFRLIHQGSHHADLPVPEYGGELFEPGRPDAEGLSAALTVFEYACFEHELVFPDSDVHRMLELLTRTRVRMRQGRASAWVAVPVDFADLSSEYIGILYEGLLDFELRTAAAADPVVFLAVGNQPALPLSRLEAMDDAAVSNLLEKMKDTSSTSPGEDTGDADAEAPQTTENDLQSAEEDSSDDEEVPYESTTADEDERATATDDRYLTRTRAEQWATRAVRVGKLVKKPRGGMTAAKQVAFDDAVSRKARQIVTRVVLPGEWYLVRWGGTRKGSGTFYTRPGLAVPTVHRTLRPLAYVPTIGGNGQSDLLAPAAGWSPRTPEEILSLKVCDPACGSGTFPVAALRFLTDALYASLHHHGRIGENGDRAIVQLFVQGRESHDGLSPERLPCRPDDPTFEPRLKAVLRRHVVERCIYGVDLDPLAVELCRLSLWIETMDRDLPFSFLDHKVKCGNALVGAWFDTFQHYPAMAWKNRDGGDKSHTNGVHFEKEARTRALKAFVKDRLTPDLVTFVRVTLGANAQLFAGRRAEAVDVHAKALATLARLHNLPVHASTERAESYRKDVLESAHYRALREAMDLWCACWLWPADRLAEAPLPTQFLEPEQETRNVARQLAESRRFFHWELEFPDAFNARRQGFDAVLGNPPWDIAKPNSKEFFSNIDPLFRSYGKQEALACQTGYFAVELEERRWLDYNADFRAQANFVKYAAGAFGDPDAAEGQDRFAIGGGRAGLAAHDDWRKARAESTGFADASHAFRHQGGADLNLYKLFLEQAHALLRPGGRLGFIVPSGIYSDHGTGDLRRLFLDHCRWEWLFGFENREEIFEIHRSYKFNPVIVQKGGSTAAIRTAFMRRNLEDWEAAEAFATDYSRAQVERFSPRSRAILEIQSARDLEVLEKIYSNSVLLGDDGPDGWGIRYATEFHMTNDSKLFPPLPKWEAQGYRPDEYSRWLKGGWRPIAELWPALGVDPSRVVPLDLGCSRRIEAPDVQRTHWRVRCAQPPYDSLPIPRAEIPTGIILSREGDAWIRQEDIEDTALPLYEGRMIGQFDFSEKGWLSGKGRGAKWPDVPWDRKVLGPQYCMSADDYTGAINRRGETKVIRGTKLGFMDVTASTNVRTMIAAVLGDSPAGNSVPVLETSEPWSLSVVLNSLAYDFVVRRRCAGLHLNWFVVDESATPAQHSAALPCSSFGMRLGGAGAWDAWLPYARENGTSIRSRWALTTAHRLRLRAAADAVIFSLLGCEGIEARHILADCDASAVDEAINPKGLWRVDQDREPELRLTVLAIVAFADLQQMIQATGGDRDRGIEAFLNQNDGEGWMLPERVRLADYGLGDDARAERSQPVASRLGPRFFDWQLAQTAEESWRECEVHAANLSQHHAPTEPAAEAPLPLSEARPRRPGLLDLMNPEAE